MIVLLRSPILYRWDEPYTTGPGLYFAIVSGYTVRDHADPMGSNQWPVATSREVLEDVDSFQKQRRMSLGPAMGLS